MSIYDYRVKDMRGDMVDLHSYKGRVLLIVNTATGCGFTPQYEGLEKLYQKYRDQGLEILDFPCNEFGHQAPGTNDEIHTFCTTKYHVTFRQFGKIKVNGPEEEKLYTYLKAQQPGVLGSRIKWNFTKFLVDRDGNVTDRYAPNVAPEKIEEDIQKLLAQKGNTMQINRQ